MLVALLSLAVLSGSDVTSPLQICSGDAVEVGRRYNMRATGRVRCSVGDLAMRGNDATVSTSADESFLDVVITGDAHAIRERDTVSGDRITVRLERVGNFWILARLLVEYSRTRMVPAQPTR
jgi:hypothetical protein